MAEPVRCPKMPIGGIWGDRCLDALISDRLITTATFDDPEWQLSGRDFVKRDMSDLITSISA